jgi:hypothetical protein
LLQALDAFEQMTYVDPHSHDERPVLDNRHWRFAVDSCMMVSQALQAHLEREGFAASRTWLGEAHTGHELLDDAGYADRLAALPDGDPASSQHCVVDVELDGQTWRIDYSALQYGYSEFPLVHVREQDGRWMRRPQLGAELAADAEFVPDDGLSL